MDPSRGLPAPAKNPMAADGNQGDVYAYKGRVSCSDSGLCGFTVRVLPWHPDAVLPYEVPLIAWADAAVEQAQMNR
jgi:hypothetical protein